MTIIIISLFYHCKRVIDILNTRSRELDLTVALTRLFDPHIHMYSRTTDDYDAMSKAGIEVIVQPSFWLGSPRTSVGTFEDYWEHMITFESIESQRIWNGAFCVHLCQPERS